VASANALLLKQLIFAGVEIHFFSKPSFVDPRPIVGQWPNFRYIPVTNSISNCIRESVEGIKVVGFAAGRLDAGCYNRLLVHAMRGENHWHRYDAILWMGDYARGRVPGVPTISFVQGAPGTDARSVLRRRAEIRRLAGARKAFQWEVLARLRLSRIGLPQFGNSDHFIVGSSVSRNCLARTYGVPSDRISITPYPIDLTLFKPRQPKASVSCGMERSDGSPIRILWLGRIIPRKRLDLFLDGAAKAIEQGLNLHMTIVGKVGFVAGYEKLIEGWPHRDRLNWIKGIQRTEVPRFMQTCDVLVQPSEEENFGSSVAEAQACGLPVIVGQTNGNADYLCASDTHLGDFLPATLADALSKLARRKATMGLADGSESRAFAERCFNVSGVAENVMAILQSVHAENRPRNGLLDSPVLGESRIKTSKQSLGSFGGTGEK